MRSFYLSIFGLVLLMACTSGSDQEGNGRTTTSTELSRETGAHNERPTGTTEGLPHLIIKPQTISRAAVNLTNAANPIVSFRGAAGTVSLAGSVNVAGYLRIYQASQDEAQSVLREVLSPSVDMSTLQGIAAATFVTAIVLNEDGSFESTGTRLNETLTQSPFLFLSPGPSAPESAYELYGQDLQNTMVRTFLQDGTWVTAGTPIP